ncbi:AAA family ATPase [Maribellus mangrovi]|uniref:AAA family ATPase n=1 Tax=Maribellus mangrovi TaxID=3133146 RepID=UPI0030EF6C8E
MKFKNPSTPFPSVGYFGPEYFCDRKVETETLIKNIEGGLSTTLVAIRRIGKTGLIKHVQYLLHDKYICIYADILPTETGIDFLNTLASAILNSVPEKTGLGQKIWSFIKSLRPVITFDKLSGEPNVSFNIQPKETTHQIENLFEFLEQQDRRVIFAVDEFQQILDYPEKSMEAWLRTTIQQLQNVIFIYSGSQPHLMNEMFANPSNPFFRSTVLLPLEKINFESYQAYIIQKFKDSKKEIESQVAAEMLDWTTGHTYFVQLLCNRVFIGSKRVVTTEVWQNEALKLLKEQEIIFLGYRDNLTREQWKLLKAIAQAGKAYSITSKSFIREYALGSSATIIRSVNSLEKKSFIYMQYDAEGNRFYSVYDVLFQRWIQNL